MTIQEKLTLAFKDLRKLGYFARQNFTCCQTCGWAEVPQGRDKVVFYHAQDKANLDKRGNCYLAWEGNGEEIVTTLQNRGLVVEWNGDENTRIKVT